MPRKQTILIIEDEAYYRSMIKEYLEDRGYKVVEASDGNQALAATAAQPPDLILLDVIMPGMDGFQVCQRLKNVEKLKDVPVIFITAKMEPEDIVKGFDAGAVDYLTKPFNSRELISRIKTHLELKAGRDFIQQVSQNRMELLHLLSHDLKNPCFNILSFAKLLEDGSSSAEILPLIQQSANQMLSIIELVCELQAIETGKIKLDIAPVNLASAMEEAKSLQQSRFQEKGVRLDIHVGEDLLILADKRTIVHTVIANLLTNALKFSMNGSTVVVAAEAREDKVIVSIKDTGIGIPNSTLPKLFNFHHKTTRSGTAQERGHGLGLPLVRKIMAAYGGSIEVSSKDINTHPETHGTIIVLTFAREKKRGPIRQSERHTMRGGEESEKYAQTL